MTLSIDNLLLRPITLSDKESLAQIANNKKIWLNVRDVFPHPYSVQDAENFINMIADIEPVTRFGIFLDGQMAGMIGLHPQQDVYRKNAEIGYWLGEPFWGQGIATKSLKLVLKYGFDQLKINRIFASVFEYNTASMRVLEKCGFQKEGISRKAIYKNEQFWDDHRYAILSPTLQT
jgi:Acetyltransferases, including N-acetylases of ribosomal proteins